MSVAVSTITRLRNLAPLLTLITLALGLSPDATLAAENNQPLECGESATYYPFGYRWAHTPPSSTHPIVISHQADGPTQTGGTTLPLADVIGAVDRAFSSWTGVDCGSNRSPNLAVESSTTLHAERNRGDTWNGSQLANHANVVFWDNSGTNASLGPGTVAYTEVLFFSATGLAIDGDMMFNDVNFQWRVGTGLTSSGCSPSESSCFDVESVALHEAGHFFGFGHVDCADATMFRTGSGQIGSTALSHHERAGVCAVYPPRNEGSNRDFGEACQTDAQCPTSGRCLVHSASDTETVGLCAERCEVHDDCDVGYICVNEEIPQSVGTTAGGDASGTIQFCRPGVAGESHAPDLCTPCSAGHNCQSGLCLSEGDTRICSQPCFGGRDDECPVGYSCIETSSNTSGGQRACWPDDVAACGPDTRLDLGGLCYIENGAADGDDFFSACGPNLICFGFRQRCGGQQGACVLFCDPSTPCPDDHLQCCYGVDQSGNCLEPSPERLVGGCFDIRQEGESCVTAEQSVCAGGLGCFDFGDRTQSRCYETCGASDPCHGDETCLHDLNDGCGNTFGLCCSNAAGSSDCYPGTESALLPLASPCGRNSDCDTGLCLKYDGDSRCSRSCDAITGTGCGDLLQCVSVSSEDPVMGKCWPETDDSSGTSENGDDDNHDDDGSWCVAGRHGNSTSATCMVFLLFGIRMWSLKRRRQIFD